MLCDPNRKEADLFWNEHTARELNALANDGATVLIPVASTEQHGPHLATGVDTFLVSAVCERAAALLAEQGHKALILPTLFVGMAEHHMAFGGTLTLRLSTYQAVLTDLCRSVQRHGFEKTLIVNGHGGNIAPLAAFGSEFADALERLVPSVTYFEYAADAIGAILEDQDKVQHACEAETSMMLAAFADKVRPSEQSNAFGGGNRPISPRNSRFARYRSFTEITDTGVVGDARRATADKGTLLIEAAAGSLAAAIAEGEPWQ